MNFARKFSDKVARSVDELYALNEDPTMTIEKAQQIQLAQLSAKRLRAFIALIEAGKVHGRGPDAEVAEGSMLADVFTVRELTEEAVRRGLPPPHVVPSQGNV